jgi:acyl carrier protein
MNTTNPTILKIVQITVDKLGVNENQLTYKTSFSDDINADSLDVFELIMTVEKEFKLKINEDDVDKITTLGALIDYIDGKVTPQKYQIEPFKAIHTKESIITKN